MKCRKNLRTLVAEYNAASSTDKPNTALMKLKGAILALKDPVTHPSLLAANPDVLAAIAADIAASELPPGTALASRYDDFVWAHHEVMMLGPNDPFGPNYAHRGPAFGPWHRELLKIFEKDLQDAAGDPELTLPYWDWTKDRSAADVGYPFTTDFLGGDGSGADDQVTTGAFAQASGWTLNIDEEGFGFLRRRFGTDGPGLPSAASVKNALAVTRYDISPWSLNATGGSSFRNTLEGWVGTAAIHNAVHRWVNGSMQPGTSPNDPIFFLHHCNIDRLWAVWEQKYPTGTKYEPTNSVSPASGLTRLGDRMSTFGRTSTDRYFGVDITPADVIDSKAITWYDSDLPDLSNETGPTLAFTGVPVGLTAYKAVKFRVVGCRPVHFRISAPPTGNFAQTSLGLEFLATPDESADFYYGYVWVQLTAVAGAIPPSSVTIHAYILDDEGYYAATDGGEYSLGDFTVTLTATTLPREDNAIALVLDRSGSMSDAAGGGSTKAALMKNAVSVFNTLMLPGDEIALVSFDDLVDPLVPMQLVSSAPIAAALAGTGLDPRGSTWIGGGLVEGNAQLALATHTNKAVIVLTDGNENVHPYVGELPSGSITSRTYAIGFGLPGTVSDGPLHTLTSNTHGDLIITGDVSSTEQRFALTKYFVQVLAGVTNQDIILDPQGSLFFGSKHVIPFDVVDADVSTDVVALCPLPELLDFTLETPSGALVKPSLAGVEPNVQYVQGDGVRCYRLMLPALAADVAGSHAGRWKAILSLRSRRDLTKLLDDKKFVAAAEKASIEGSLPYSLVAYTFSNLRFDARIEQKSFAPGASVAIVATLKVYDVPFADDAVVWAELTHPDRSTADLKLKKVGTGKYSASFTAASPGVYACRVRAEGYSKGKKFTREKTLTAGVFVADPSTTAPGGGELCEALRCLLSGKVLTPKGAKRLAALGIDVAALRACLAARCETPMRERATHAPAKVAPKRRKQRAVPVIDIQDEPKAEPIKREPPSPRPGMVHMTMDEKRSFPRIVRMFDPLPDGGEPQPPHGSHGGGEPPHGSHGGGGHEH